VDARRVIPSRYGTPDGGCYEIMMSGSSMITMLAQTLDLGSLLGVMNGRYGAYDLVAHWTQGEFHHDVVMRVGEAALASPKDTRSRWP
jgi:hypothetical protein